MRFVKRGSIVAGVAALGMVLAAAPAGAVTIVLGPPSLATGFTNVSHNCALLGAPSDVTCTPEFTNLVSADSSTVLVVPTDGVVTTWSMVGALTEHSPSTATATLDIARPAGGANYISAGKSTPSHAVPTNAAVNLAVRAGDRLAVLINCVAVGGSGGCSAAVNFRAVAASTYGLMDNGINGGVVLDPTTPLPFISSAGFEAGFNANVTLLAPVITSVSPAFGSPDGAETVTITGQHLAVATAVSFDGAPGAIVSATDESMTVRTPPHALGATTLSVTTAGGTGSTTFTYGTPPPTTTPITIPSIVTPPLKDPPLTISVKTPPTRLKVGKGLKLGLKVSEKGRYTVTLSGSACPKSKKGQRKSTACSTRSKTIKTGTATITIPTSKLKPGKLTITITVVSADRSDKPRHYTAHITLNR